MFWAMKYAFCFTRFWLMTCQNMLTDISSNQEARVFFLFFLFFLFFYFWGGFYFCCSHVLPINVSQLISRALLCWFTMCSISLNQNWTLNISLNLAMFLIKFIKLTMFFSFLLHMNAGCSWIWTWCSAKNRSKIHMSEGVRIKALARWSPVPTGYSSYSIMEHGHECKFFLLIP